MKFYIRDWISACAKCKSLRSPIRLFCEDCWSQIYDLQNGLIDFPQPHYPFPVYSLFSWRAECDHLIRPLIYGLKGGKIRAPWNEFAAQFMFLRGQLNLEGDFILVLPPRKKKEDHAYWWAQALSSWSLASVVDCLEFDGNQKSQKLKSLKERQERKFVRRDEYDFENAKVIFVDDTITSGGTAQAAFEALNYPDDFEVWTLVSRPQFGTQ